MKDNRNLDHASRPFPSGAGLLLIVIMAVFAVVRLLGVFNDLWLDEIWSIKMVETIKSPLEIFTVLRHDNNHPLNSLFIYGLMPVEADWTYRLLSWFTGSMSVWLAALIGRRQYQALHPAAAKSELNVAGMLTAVLIGGAYLLIHYSSEARGYAPALMFGLLAFLALQQTGRSRWWLWAVGYWLACALGLLAHLAMVQVMIAGTVFTGLELIRRDGSWGSRVRQALGWHLLPWLGFVAYYFGFIREMEIGGGPDNPLAGVLAEVAAYLLGFPVSTGLTMALPLLLSLIGVAGHLMIRNGGWRLVVCYGLLIFATPVIGILFGKFTLLFPRYFLANAAFALVLAGYGLTRLWLRGGLLRIAVMVALGCFMMGNAVHVSRLLHDGRGQYRAALRDIAARTASNEITIGSDHDFRNYVLVDYYRGVTAPKTLTYHPNDQPPPWGVEWLLLHRLDGQPPPPALIADGRGIRYARQQVYPHAALSGWDWFIYRRE